MNGIVLALDVSSTTTGYAVIDSKARLIEYGQFTIKDRELSDTMYGVTIADKVLQLVEKHKVVDVMVENIFYSRNPDYFRRWARVHGSISLAWYKKSKKEVKYMMAITARPKVGINGHATKIEIQLAMAKKYGLVKDEIYYDFCSRFDALLKQKKNKELTKNKFDYKVGKLSKEFEEVVKLSEHQADSMVLGLAYFK